MVDLCRFQASFAGIEELLLHWVPNLVVQVKYDLRCLIPDIATLMPHGLHYQQVKYLVPDVDLLLVAESLVHILKENESSNYLIFR